MSKYTSQLRWIVEQIGQGLPVPEGQRYASAVYKYIGLDRYPIFEEGYRSYLNDKIIDHFFFREIGFETAAQFAFYMRRTMNEIMPYYNKLYVTQSMVDDPLNDFKRTMHEEWDSNRQDTGTVTNTTASAVDEDETSSTSSTDHNRNVFQDTPMSLLDNDGHPSIEGLDYATTATYDDGNGTTSGSRSLDRSENGTNEREDDLNRDESGNRDRTDVGRNKSQSLLLQEYRDTLLNIDMDVIGELETLFMGLW